MGINGELLTALRPPALARSLKGASPRHRKPLRNLLMVYAERGYEVAASKRCGGQI